MPTIAVLIAWYRSNEPDGIRLQLARDYEDEDIAAALNDVRRQCDELYATLLAAGATPDQALLWMQSALRDAGRRRGYLGDIQLSLQLAGIIDKMERLGALTRDIHNGLYVPFADPFPTSG